MAIKTIKNKNLTWYLFEGFGDKENKYIKRKFDFHPLDIKDCYAFQQNPKLDIYEKYLFLVFHFPEYKKGTQKIEMNELDIFIGEDFVITIMEKPFKYCKELFYKCYGRNDLKNEYMSEGPGYLLYKILSDLYYQTSEPGIEHLSKILHRLEKEIFESKKTRSLVSELASLRRNILTFRSIVEPQKLIIKTLVNMEHNGIINKKLSPYFDDINDYIERLWVISTNYKELLEGLNQTNESLISYRTNETVKILTLISVALLPLTLLSGIYGMNISLPFQHLPHFVWLIYLALLLSILGIMYYFKKKGKI